VFYPYLYRRFYQKDHSKTTMKSFEPCTFFAVDLGATSGRTILGTLSGEGLALREVTRFQNPIIHMRGHCYWDIYALYREILEGLAAVAREGVAIRSIGIDTWGVDFAFVGADGDLLRNPYSYRDPHTEGAMDDLFKAVSRERVYELTGIQFMNFNSLFQLYQLQRTKSSALRAADKILFMPDALSYLLTGVCVTERTIASTSQMLNPRTGQLEAELLDVCGISRGQFGPMVQPGTVIGTLTPEVRRLTGLGAVPVVAVAGHDTASAVAAVPARGERFAYLSSGTWSLMGIETRAPIINKESFERNFTNEGGVEGTTRFLKNICGMWLLERSRAEWKAEGKPYSYDYIYAHIPEVPAFRSLFHPDAPCFRSPESMVGAIQDYCRRTAQPVPETTEEVCRCIFDSLALRYRQVFGYLKEMAPFPLETLHIIGGGTQNVLLNQLTANATGVTVITGPIECTAIGNIMLQAKAAGIVNDIRSMRTFISDSIETNTYPPQDAALWDMAFSKYLTFCKEGE